MATTYNKIATVTVGSGGAANIEFTSIPATYTDLCLVLSLRSARSDTDDSVALEFNSSSTNLSMRRILGTGSSASSASTSTIPIRLVADTATASTFGNTCIYIPNYASSNYKSVFIDNVTEANATLAFAELVAGLWSSSSAITSIKLTSQNAANVKQYSTATLYGIKNS